MRRMRCNLKEYPCSANGDSKKGFNCEREQRKLRGDDDEEEKV